MSLFSTNGFLVEDGNGNQNSTSYLSVADATNYLNNLGKGTAFDALTNEQKQSYLMQATLFIDKEFCFAITKRKETQALQFPQAVEPHLPENIKIATIELAEIIRNGNLFYSPGEKETFVSERKVGPITTKFTKATEIDGPQTKSKQKNKLDFVKELLSPFIYSPLDQFIRG